MTDTTNNDATTINNGKSLTADEDEILLDKTMDPIGKVFKFLNQDDTFTHWIFVSKGPSTENPGNEDYTVYYIEGNETNTVDVKAFHEIIIEFALSVDYIPVEEYVNLKNNVDSGKIASSKTL